MTLSPLAAAAIIAVVLYLYKLNKALKTVPRDALAYSPRRWTDDEIRETYERVCRQAVDFSKLLPPKLGRRYIVVGGSGESLVVTVEATELSVSLRLCCRL